MLKNLKQRWYVPLAMIAMIAGLLNFFPHGSASYAELEYSEYSDTLGESAGAIIPASCESSPPTNHSGDCPVNVQTSIRSDTDRITATLTAPGYNMYSGQRISWTSTGATFCASTWTSAQLGTSGTYAVTAPQCTTIERTYSIRCYDGVFWSNLSSVTVEVEGPWTTRCGPETIPY